MVFILKLIEFRVKTKHLMQRKLQQKIFKTRQFQSNHSFMEEVENEEASEHTIRGVICCC